MVEIKDLNPIKCLHTLFHKMKQENIDIMDLKWPNHFQHLKCISTSIVGTDIRMSNLDIRLSNLDIRMSSLDIRMSKLILEFGKNNTAKNSKFLVGFRMFFQIFNTLHG